MNVILQIFLSWIREVMASEGFEHVSVNVFIDWWVTFQPKCQTKITSIDTAGNSYCRREKALSETQHSLVVRIDYNIY